MKNLNMLIVVVLCSIISLQVSARPARSSPKPATLVLDSKLRLSSLPAIEVKVLNAKDKYTFPNKNKVINYYLKLNRKLVRKNPIVDAKRAFDSGQYIVLPEEFDGGAFISKLTAFRKQYPRHPYKPNYEPSPRMQAKLLQGSNFFNDWYHRTSGRDNKILLLYGQSVLRYSYYWNRTMNHYIKCCYTRK